MLSSAGLKAMAGEAGSMSVAAGARSNAGALDTAGAAGDDSLKVDVLQGAEVLATRVSLSAEQTPRMVTVLRAADIAAAAVHSVNDLLEYAVGVDVRQRGEFGVQTDVSVRGGNLELLSDQSLSYEEVTKQSGFSSLQAMSKFLDRRIHLTAYEYREGRSNGHRKR